MDVGNLLFPALYQFENGLRIALDSFLQTCYGPDWWDASLKGRLNNTFVYAEGQRKKLDAMPWIGDSSAVKVLPVHLITLGQLEEIVEPTNLIVSRSSFPISNFSWGTWN